MCFHRQLFKFLVEKILFLGKCLFDQLLCLRFVHPVYIDVHSKRTSQSYDTQIGSGIFPIHNQRSNPCFFKQLFDAGCDVRVLAGKKIASVGKITEKKLLEYGIRCDYVPEDHTAEGLGKLLASLPADSHLESNGESKILLLQGNLADDTLLKYLPHATRWIVYETLPVSDLPEWKREAVATADAIVFASTSAVNNFVKLSASADLEFKPLAFCIGRMTESAAQKYGYKTVVSEETTMDSLVKRIVEYYG